MQRKILQKVGVFFTDPDVSRRYDHHDLARFLSSLETSIGTNFQVLSFVANEALKLLSADPGDKDTGLYSSMLVDYLVKSYTSL